MCVNDAQISSINAAIGNEIRMMSHNLSDAARHPIQHKCTHAHARAARPAARAAADAPTHHALTQTQNGEDAQTSERAARSLEMSARPPSEQHES